MARTAMTKSAMAEKEILLMLSSPFVVRMHNTYKTADYLSRRAGALTVSTQLVGIAVSAGFIFRL